MSEPCGCSVQRDAAGYMFPARCPLHAAAPALLEALEILYACNVWYGPIDDGDKARLLKARTAITLAKGAENTDTNLRTQLREVMEGHVNLPASQVRKSKKGPKIPLCSKCGSVVSAVTWECVRGTDACRRAAIALAKGE